MPLQDLVRYFNQRITEEQGLESAPLSIRQGLVESRHGGFPLATEFHPVRRASSLDQIAGMDASLRAYPPETSQSLTARVFQQTPETSGVVNLDRLCRTIHMLNFLPIAHDHGHLFVHVHPRHVLGVDREHGAYFEDVIFRCGLTPRQVVISVAIAPLYDRQLSLLLAGLKNYQRRGYSTAIKFEGQADEDFLERYYIEFLNRITPDFVRLSSGFLASFNRGEIYGMHRTSLLSIIHGLDTELLVEGINEAEEAAMALELRAALVRGRYYEGAEVRGIAV